MPSKVFFDRIRSLLSRSSPARPVRRNCLPCERAIQYLTAGRARAGSVLYCIVSIGRTARDHRQRGKRHTLARDWLTSLGSNEQIRCRGAAKTTLPCSRRSLEMIYRALGPIYFSFFSGGGVGDGRSYCTLKSLNRPANSCFSNSPLGKCFGLGAILNYFLAGIGSTIYLSKGLGELSRNGREKEERIQIDL